MKIRTLFLAATLAATALLGLGYWNATRDPIIRKSQLQIANWPANERPAKILLLSDLHITAPDMTPERLERLIGELNALNPDLVLLAGDFYSDKRFATRLYSAAEIVAPLKQFRATWGVIAVLGNHDIAHDAEGFRREFRLAGIPLLENQAVVRGPLVIGGVNDEFSRNDDVSLTMQVMKGLKGVPVVLTHSPDIVPKMAEPVAAVFAGHTHCGQANLPWSGESINSSSRYGMRYQCGEMGDNGQHIFVTAGLGTSVVPLRYGAPPDAWLVTLGR